MFFSGHGSSFGYETGTSVNKPFTLLTMSWIAVSGYRKKISTQFNAVTHRDLRPADQLLL
jgi:hypothetical protein